MPFIWNDKTFMDRVKFSQKKFFKIDIPLYFFNLLLWSFLTWDKVHIIELILLAAIASAFIYSFINMFLQLPHIKIPSDYPKEIQTIFYIFFFILSGMLFYWITVGILQNYYTFFQDLVCCDFIKISKIPDLTHLFDLIQKSANRER